MIQKKRKEERDDTPQQTLNNYAKFSGLWKKKSVNENWTSF